MDAPSAPSRPNGAIPSMQGQGTRRLTQYADARASIAPGPLRSRSDNRVPVYTRPNRGNPSANVWWRYSQFDKKLEEDHGTYWGSGR
jgi:hypothetical protein